MPSAYDGRSRRAAAAAAALLCLALANPVSAQQTYSARPIAGHRAERAPTIDGALDDALWKSAPKAETFIDKVTEQPAAEQTEAWIAYDTEAIYIAYRCRDAKPDEIVAREVRYGSSMDGDDVVAFTVDPFYTKGGDVSLFVVNPRGTQREAMAGGRAAKREWSGVWQAAARRDGTGWTAEVRIPWAMLNYPQGKTGVRIGVNFYRYQARLKTLSMWSNQTKSDHGDLIGVWQGIDPPARGRPSRLQVMAYAAGEAAEQSSGIHPRAGLDLRYAPSQSQTGVLSLFPDFRNVEQSVEGIQFSRTERYLVDTRPFFVEGRNFFPGQFYSQRIGSFDVGAKAYGRIGPGFSYGFLGLTDGDREQDGVGQVAYSQGDRFGASGYGMIGRGGRPDNDQYGLSAGSRVGHWYETGEWNRARTAAYSGSDVQMKAGFWDGRTNVELQYQDTSPTYAPSLSFIGFNNSRTVHLKSSYNRESRTGPFQSFGCIGGAHYASRYGGYPYSRFAEATLYASTRTNYQFDISKHVGQFYGARDDVTTLHLATSTDSRYKRADLRYEFGTLGGVRSQFWSVGSARRVLRKMDLGLSASFRRDVERRNQIIGTMGWEFDAHRAVVGRLVATDADLNWYMAFRNSGGLGQEWYVIVGDPNAEDFRERLAVKWVWAH